VEAFKLPVPAKMRFGLGVVRCVAEAWKHVIRAPPFSVE